MAIMAASKGSLKEFLDSNQYTETNIRNYEIVFGKEFICTGGKDVTKCLTKSLNLKNGDYVLDFGCGVGGSASYMASSYGCKVLGIDVSSNMIKQAEAYRQESNDSAVKHIEYRVCDGTEEDFPENTFDCIYSREVIIHVEDKGTLFNKFFKWLKPNGKILISDYCSGDKGTFSDGFLAYIGVRKYCMQTLVDYRTYLEQAGFREVKAEDKSEECIRLLKTDATFLYKNKPEILEKITRFEYDNLVSAWDRKLKRNESGDEMWCLYTATK